MSQKNDDGLEFDQPVGEMSRSSFRVPIDKTWPIEVQIAGQKFEAVNLMSYGRSGIGVLLRHQESFSVGEELPAVLLILDGKALTLRGTVRHVSINGGGSYLCGIEFTRLSRKDRRTLKDFCDSCRAVLFAAK